MNEEEKAIKFLENKTTNYSLSGEALHYYSILYYLIINLQKKNKQLKEQNEFLMKQDNILQTLMQWLYSQYNESLSKFEMIRMGNKDYKIYEKVIDKIEELKKEMQQ